MMLCTHTNNVHTILLIKLFNVDLDYHFLLSTDFTNFCEPPDSMVFVLRDWYDDSLDEDDPPASMAL